MTKKPVCVKCGRGMVPSKIGVEIVELYLVDQPYKIWPADILKCPECGIEVAWTDLSNPIAEAHTDADLHYEAAKINYPDKIVLQHESEWSKKAFEGRDDESRQ